MNSLMVGSKAQPIVPLSSNANFIQPGGSAGAGFADILRSALEKTSAAEIQSDLKTEALAKGDIEDMHSVMIAAQKASITLEATVQVQSKVIDAYNEIMRMQV